MASATKPPMIAPGILCPKCKGVMLDERTTKRTDKSPDYTCANMTCVTPGSNGKSYRTAIWAEKSSGAENGSAGGGGNAGNPASASPVESSEKPRLDRIYIRATKLILDEVVPLYTKAGIGMSDTAVAACVQTLFIAASRDG